MLRRIDFGLASRFYRIGTSIERSAHWYYLAVAIPVILFLAMAKGPLGAHDEWSHVARAAQIAQGVVIAPVVDGMPMGDIDRNLKVLTDDLHNIHNLEPLQDWTPHYETLTWGETAPHSFNHAVYFPLLYIPQTLTVLVGRWLDASILNTLAIGSFLTGLVCVGLGTLAVRLTPVAKLPLAFILAFPMNLFLFASFSADGPLMGMAALLGAAATRLWTLDDPLKAKSVLALAILAALVVAPAKLVYAPAAAAVLAILVFHPSADWRLRGIMLVSAAATVGAALVWHGVSDAGHATFGPGDADRQMAFTLQHPGAVFSAFLTSLREHGTNYLEHMIGVLGWLDTRLMPWLYPVAWYLLGAAAAAEVLRCRQGPVLPWWLGTGVLGAVLLSLGGIFLSIYLIWTPPETADFIDGVQGRYFLPLLPLLLPLFLAVPSVPATGLGNGTRALLMTVAASLFPFFALGATFEAILRRYYY